jgi:Purple acid Phosphatase, N-terminal domain
MNTLVAILGLSLTFSSGALLQVAKQSTSPPALPSSAQTSRQAPAVQQVPATPMGAPSQAVQITNGPVVENVTDTTVEIAWSTNVNSGTALHYGTDATHLDQTAGMPWGGFTHRVFLKGLKPNTTYYFKAESGQGQGTGSQAETAQASFQTKAAGTTAQK